MTYPNSYGGLDEAIVKLLNDSHVAHTITKEDPMYNKFCELLRFDKADFKKNRRSIRYYLNIMFKKGLIDRKNLGTGIFGIRDYGCATINFYAKNGFFLNALRQRS